MPDVSSTLPQNQNSPTATQANTPPAKQDALTLINDSQNGAAAFKETSEGNTKPKYGVKNIEQPPDPYEQAEKFSPLPNAAVQSSPSLIKKPDTPEAILQKPAEPANIPATPTAGQDPVVVIPPGTPPQNPTDYSSYILPKKHRSPLIFIVPLVLLLLGLIVFGIYFFLSRPKGAESGAEPDLGLNLVEEPVSQGKAVDSSSFKAPLPVKEKVTPEKAFGNLPPPNVESLVLRDLTLAGTIIANEATPSVIPEKVEVYVYSGDANLASSSAIFSPGRTHITEGLKTLSQEQFLGQIGQDKSLYPIKGGAQAFTDLISANPLIGLSEKKIDWKKNRLKSVEITDYYIAHLYTPHARFFLPFYVFEGNGKILGGDSKTGSVKFEFLVSAVLQ